MSITLVRSSPVTVTVPGVPWLPACTSTLVITPSNSGCGVPFRVTTRSTRKGGAPSDVLLPAAIRKMVLRSDLLSNWNRSWKPLAAASEVSHFDTVERIHDDTGRRNRDSGTHHQSELDALRQQLSPSLTPVPLPAG